MPTMIYRAFGLDTAWRRKGILIAAVTAAALGAGVLSIAAAQHQGGSTVEPASASTPATDSAVAWDRAHRDEFVQLKSQGDALAIEGKLQLAYDTYQQCLTRISDHELTDPVVIATLKSAQENQSRLVAQILIPDGSPSQVAAPAREGQSAPIVLASAAQPSTAAGQLNDQFRTNPLRNNQPSRSASASSVPNDPGSGNLFGTPANPGAGRVGGSDLGDGRAASDPRSYSDLPDLFQPYSGSEPGTVGQTPSPQVIVKRTPEPAPGAPALGGSATEPVSVTVLNRQSAPVTGNVDGHPFSLGGPGEPMSETFTGLPAGPIPFTLQGRQYTYYGGTDYVPLAGGEASTPPPPARESGSGLTELPFGGSPVQTTPSLVPPTIGNQPVAPPKKGAPVKKPGV